MAAQPSLEPSAQPDDPVRMRLVQSLPPHMLQSLLAIEQDAFPACERLGRHAMVEHAMCRANGLLVAEPPLPEAEPSPMGFLLYSRTADAGIIMKLAVAAAFRGRGVGRALLRCGISELRRPARRAPPPAIMLHVDPARTAARGLYESVGFQEEKHLCGYYSDGHAASELDPSTPADQPRSPLLLTRLRPMPEQARRAAHAATVVVLTRECPTIERPRTRVVYDFVCVVVECQAFGFRFGYLKFYRCPFARSTYFRVQT